MPCEGGGRLGVMQPQAKECWRLPEVLCVCVCVCVCVAQSCLSLCDSINCSLPSSSVHGIL